METRLKEHRDAHNKGNTETSAVAEDAWNTLHSILWDVTTIVGQARGIKELKIMEALHNLVTPIIIVSRLAVLSAQKVAAGLEDCY